MSMQCLNVLIAVLIVFGIATHASASDPSYNDYCLSCHSKEASKTFADGSSISVKINAQSLQRSVHGKFACTDCHKEFSSTNHPYRPFASKKQYQITMSNICKECHSQDSIKTKHIHDDLFRQQKQGKAIICTDCHSAHSVNHTSKKDIHASSNQQCLSCHSKDGIYLTFTDGSRLLLKVDAEAINKSAHRHIQCTDCHGGYCARHHPKRIFKSHRHFRIANSEVCKQCHSDKYWNFKESVHYKLISFGRLEAPTCVDCHGSHDMHHLRGSHIEIAKKCKNCHKIVYETYSKSIHGSQLLGIGNSDVPVCTDCHSSHKIKKTSHSEFHNKIPTICGNCHADKNLMDKYGLSTDVLKTYLSDFHGGTLNLYSKDPLRQYHYEPEIAVCTDCHGVHDIQKATGQNAKVLKSNLIHRCRNCHPDATENFPDAWMSHYKPGFSNAPLIFVINSIYSVLFPLSILGVGFIMVLRLYRLIKDKQSKDSVDEFEEGDETSNTVKYFNVYRIIEHALLLLSFFVLALTGLPQKFNDFVVSQWLIKNLGGVVFVRQLHHVVGYLFAGLFLQHVIVNVIAIYRGYWYPTMFITLKDSLDALHDIKYYLGLVNEPSHSERYSYKEKFIYWLTLTAGLQMIITGIVLNFPIFFAGYLPGQVIPVAKVLHSNEAMLIFILVVIWHVYDVIFRAKGPDLSIFTGYKRL